MKRLAVALIAVATICAAIPAEAAPRGARGDSGRGGRPHVGCFTSTMGKRATTCPTAAPYFWLP